MGGILLAVRIFGAWSRGRGEVALEVGSGLEAEEDKAGSSGMVSEMADKFTSSTPSEFGM